GWSTTNNYERYREVLTCLHNRRDENGSAGVAPSRSGSASACPPLARTKHSRPHTAPSATTHGFVPGRTAEGGISTGALHSLWKTCDRVHEAAIRIGCLFRNFGKISR